MHYLKSGYIIQLIAFQWGVACIRSSPEPSLFLQKWVWLPKLAPTHLTTACSKEKHGSFFFMWVTSGWKGWYKECIGTPGLITAKRVEIPTQTILINRRQLSYTQDFEHIFGWIICKILPFHSENICHLPIMSYSHDKSCPSQLFCKMVRSWEWGYISKVGSWRVCFFSTGFSSQPSRRPAPLVAVLWWAVSSVWVSPAAVLYQ